MNENPSAPGRPENLFAAGAQSLIENANRLGLTWQLRLGTILKTGVSPTAIMDGDSAEVAVVPMAGNMDTGSRVYIIGIPGGNYVVGQVAQWETGQELITFVTLAQTTVAVTFERPFVIVPRVVTNIDSGAGSTARWVSRAFSITKAGFTLFVFSAQAVATSWTDVPVSWVAMAS